MLFPFDWAAPDIAERAAKIKKELENRDLSREKLLELAAAHKAHGEWVEGLLHSREADARLHTLAFPACCKSFVGFESYVRSSGTVAVVSRVQLPFKGCRLAVDPECAPFFSIIDIKVGHRSAFLNCHPVAATLFPPIVGDWNNEEQEKAHEQIRFRLDLAQIAQDISIEVQNIDPRGTSHNFRAALWGHRIE